MSEITIEKIRKCKRLITHAYSPTVECPDGIASAMLIKAALPDIEVVFCAYGTDQHLGMEARHGDIWCDFTPHRDQVEKHVRAESVVLDHHKGARDIVEQFRFGVFADEKDDPGVSGAGLALREIYEPLCQASGGDMAAIGEQMFLMAHLRGAQHLAFLAGVRDTWQRSSPFWKDSCAQQAALVFIGASKLLESEIPYLSHEEQLLGDLLVERREREAESAARNAIRMGSLLVISSSELTSDTAEAIKRLDLAEHRGSKVLVGFSYRIEPNDVSIVFSMRSIGETDVLKIAQENGGGGHTKAAGFTVSSIQLLPGGLHPSPFAVLLSSKIPAELLSSATIISGAQSLANSGLWCVWVMGPDSMIAQPSHDVAVERAISWHKRIVDLSSHRARTCNEEALCCDILPVPYPWPYDAASHAAGLLDHGGDPEDIC